MKTVHDHQRWTETDRVLTLALDRPPEERAAFIEAQCGDDGDLREAVTRLLSHVGKHSPLDTSGAQFREELFREAADDWDRLAMDAIRIDRYVLIREIGRGGMGTVFLAERSDGAFEQRAAVKVLRRGLDTEHVLARFRSERRILASLDHPNIARLLDGGATTDGRPYLVMELVEGMPITDYCATHNLGVEDRLGLLISIGRALEHAHRNLVVHRDIKPSNILVTGDGVPKLLDFGIAKVLDPTITGDTNERTVEHARFMTPEYASPEQVLGNMVTTRTDVYQFGVLLYMLLTDCHPFQAAVTSSEELRLAVLEQTPDPPSVAAATRRRCGPSSGRVANFPDPSASRNADLDAITLMAIRKEPERRYASVAAFVEDIQRHLEGRPVLAVPDTWRYRARKFTRRHRTGVAAAASFVLLAIAFVTGLVAYTVRLDKALAETTEQRETVKETVAFLTSLFESNGDAQADQVSAGVLLERGAERVRADLANRPEILATLLTTLGEIHLSMGSPAKAKPLLDDALALKRTLHGPADMAMAEVLFRRGHFHVTGRGFAEAEPFLAEAAAIFEQHGKPARVALGHALADLAVSLKETGDAASAEAAVRRAISILGAELGDDDPTVDRQYAQLAGILRRQEKWAEAEALYREVLLRAMAAQDVATIAQTRNDLAYLLRLREQYVEAESLYRATLTAQMAVSESDRNTGIVLNNLASVLSLQGKHDEAIRLRSDYLLTMRRAFEQDHWRIGSALGSLALAYMDAGRPADAEPLYRQSIATYEAGLGPEHAWTLSAHARTGAVLTALKRFEDAERMLRAAYDISLTDQTTAQLQSARLELQTALADLYAAWDRPEMAEEFHSALASSPEDA